LRTAVAKWPPSFALFSVSRRENVMSSDDRSNRARASNLLKKRIEINHAYSSTDFNAWLLERLAVKSGEHVLDVGCGTGRNRSRLPAWSVQTAAYHLSISRLRRSPRYSQ
jgi:protein-L-isoaspartate O-methyltransferase